MKTKAIKKGWKLYDDLVANLRFEPKVYRDAKIEKFLKDGWKLYDEIKQQLWK